MRSKIREWKDRKVFCKCICMTISPVNINFPAIRLAVESIRQSERMMLDAVEAVMEGDIVDAALLTNQAKLTAAAGVAIAREANEIEGMIMDIIA